MRVILIFAVVLVLMDNVLANPLLEGGLAARTLFQQNMKCNTQSAFKRITMTNIVSDGKNCDYTIRAYSTKVCQLRIDFLHFNLQQPRTTAGRPYYFCSGDRLTINGLDFPLCGNLDMQHVYVPFDVQRISETKLLDFEISSTSSATWMMEINQIECSHKAALVTFDERQAPDGCLQYFYQPSSTVPVKSFNFGYVYYGNTHYAICFNRKYNKNAALELYDIVFEMDGDDPGFDDNCLVNDAAGDPPTPKDFIAIPFADVSSIPPVPEDPHSLFCATSLHGKELTFTGAGPIVIHVNTDTTTKIENALPKESGFSFKYRITSWII